jgi:Ca-activated chloride channel homolog
VAEILGVTFRSPSTLWLLAALPPAFIFLLARERRRNRLARSFAAERMRGVRNGVRGIRPLLLAIALLLAVIGLAGPQFGYRTMPIEARESNRVVVLDVSDSMSAEDAGASRLVAAKAIARRIISQHSGRIALIIFEDSAEVVSPLTTDTEAVISLLDSINTGDVDDPGSDLGRALLAALQLVDADPGQKADIVVLSDGEDQGRHVELALQKLHGKGVPVSTIVIGSAEGTTIPVNGGRDVLHDTDGNVVTTRANDAVLEQVAHATGGQFYRNPFGQHAVDPLIAAGEGGRAQQKMLQVPIDRYQWPLGLAFVMFLCGSIANRGTE